AQHESQYFRSGSIIDRLLNLLMRRSTLAVLWEKGLGDFAILNWPHFDHYIPPPPTEEIALPCRESRRGGRWTGDARWSYSKRSGGNMRMERARFVQSRRNWACIGGWCDKRWPVRFRRSANWRRETSPGWVR